MALSKKARNRLTTLINFMASLPKSANGHFDMGLWFGHSGPHDHGIGKFIRTSDLRKCGTTACAMGWAAIVPSFRRAGLKVKAHGYDNTGYNDRAALRFFGINKDQRLELFGAYNHDSTPKAWAQRARNLLREWDKESRR